MRSRGVRLALVLLLIVGVAAAAWQVYAIERRSLDSMRHQQTLDGLRDQALHAITEARTAQQAYLAQGQGLDFWHAKFAEGLAGVAQSLAGFRAEAAGQADALEAVEAADRALKVYEGVDRKIRGFVENDTTLMAADAVYEDGIKISGVIRDSILQAHGALVGPARRGYEQRQLQYIIMIGAVGAGVLVSLMLLPTGPRDDQPTVEIHSPGSLTLSDRPLRPEAAAAVATPAADMLRPPRDDRRDVAPVPRPEAPSPVVAAPVAAPAETRQHAPPLAGADDAALEATARVCTDLARVKDADELRDALGRAARLLDATGVIVWITEAGGRSLKPLLTYGYPEEALRRIPTLPREADNATAAAWRDAVTQVVEATDSAPGAIAVPLLVPQGCVGVLAAEIGHGREAAVATRALAQIVAAQLAVLIPAETPQDA